MGIRSSKLRLFFFYSVFVALFPTTAESTLLSDTSLGVLRPVLKDSLYQRDNDDPYRVLGNPAWGVEASSAAIGYHYQNANLAEQGASDQSQVLSFIFQERTSDWSFGLFSIIPMSQQPVLDTGDETIQASPWVTMSKQLLYAMNASYHFERWSLGLLMPIYFSASTIATSDLDSSNVNTRATVTLRPSVSLAVGLNYKLSEQNSLSLFYKEVSRAKTEALVQGNIPLLSLDLIFAGESSYAFDPRRVSVSFSRERNNLDVWGVKLKYSDWSQFTTPYVVLTDSNLAITDTTPQGRAKDSWEFATSYLGRLSDAHSWALSLSYRESPFSQISSYYDSDALSLAAGYSMPLLDEWEGALTGQLQLMSRDVVYTWLGFGLRYQL